jgi:hypothetical protein
MLSALLLRSPCVQRARRLPSLRLPRAAASASWLEELEYERKMAQPRIEFGTDVHRRVHLIAARSPAYLFQWRAFCERQSRDWRDAHGTFDEDLLAVFHFELERQLASFKADAEEGRLDAWPQRSVHPTQGLPALAAAMRSACEQTIGRTFFWV